MRKQTNNDKRLARSLFAIVVVVVSAFPFMAFLSGTNITLLRTSEILQGEIAASSLLYESFESDGNDGDNINGVNGPIGTWSFSAVVGTPTGTVHLDGTNKVLELIDPNAASYHDCRLTFDDPGHIGDVISLKFKPNTVSGGYIFFTTTGGGFYIQLSMFDADIYYYDTALSIFDSGEDQTATTWQTLWVNFLSDTQFKVHVGATEPNWGTKSARDCRVHLTGDQHIEQIGFYGSGANAFTWLIDDIKLSWACVDATESFESDGNDGDNINSVNGPIGTWSFSAVVGTPTGTVHLDGTNKVLELIDPNAASYHDCRLTFDEPGHTGDVISLKFKPNAVSGGYIFFTTTGGGLYIQLSMLDADIDYYNTALELWDSGEDQTAATWQTLWVNFLSDTQFKVHVGATEPDWGTKSARDCRVHLTGDQHIEQIGFYGSGANAFTWLIDDIKPSWTCVHATESFESDGNDGDNINSVNGPIGTWSFSAVVGTPTGKVHLDGSNKVLELIDPDAASYHDCRLTFDEPGHTGDVISLKFKPNTVSGGYIFFTTTGGGFYIQLSMLDANIKYYDTALSICDSGEDQTAATWQTLWVNFLSDTQFKVHVGAIEPDWGTKSALDCRVHLTGDQHIEQIGFYGSGANAFTWLIDDIRYS